MEFYEYDYLIVGAGMVGLSIAHQLKINSPKKKICIIEKESEVGFHSSGRNSGVLHAGIYYKPDTLKSKLCIDGSKRLKKWCKEQNIEILECGKVISPQDHNLDFQLDNLLYRGKKNGAELEIINQKKFEELVPNGRTSSGRAIWSPNTSVISPLQVIKKLSEQLIREGIDFLFNTKLVKFYSSEQVVISRNNSDLVDYKIKFGHLFNCAGLHSDKVGKLFDIGKNFNLIPFKGIYWELKKKPNLIFDKNLYPVPDLNMPFLGVHVTPSIDKKIYLGPTAIPAFGSENYFGLDGLEPLKTLKNFGIMATQLIKNENKFRNYASEQALLGFKYLFFKSAKKLVPSLEIDDILPSRKVGIRPQLYNNRTKKLLTDFHLERTTCSTHILNAISPAFTASFAFADYVINFGLKE